MRFRIKLAAFSICLIVLTACSKEAPPKPKETARAVTVATVELRPIAGRSTATGLLAPREEAAVGVEIAGFRVKDVLVDEGDMVERGQAMAHLDDTLLRAKIAQAQANHQQAQGEANRVKGLDGTGVLSDEEIAQRRSQALVTRAQLDDLMTQAARMTIRAPLSGLVLQRSVRPGSVSGGSEPMFRIARDRLIELDAEVSEEALASIELGSAALVTIPGGAEFDGVVRLISPRIDPQTKLGRVRVSLPVDPALRVGGFATASFRRDAAPVLAVPEKAVQFEASGPLVTLISDDNRAKRMPVRTGARANGYVELIEGPPAGARVALGGGAFLLDGDLVTPMNSEGMAEPSPAAVKETPAPESAGVDQ